MSEAASEETILVWRSMLYVPANNSRFIDKAHTRGADAIILDLEDSVPASERDAARAMLVLLEDQDAALGCDRHDRNEGTQVDLIEIIDPTAIRQFDRLARDLEIRRGLEDDVLAEGFPMPVSHVRRRPVIV